MRIPHRLFLAGPDQKKISPYLFVGICVIFSRRNRKCRQGHSTIMSILPEVSWLIGLLSVGFRVGWERNNDAFRDRWSTHRRSDQDRVNINHLFMESP